MSPSIRTVGRVTLTLAILGYVLRDIDAGMALDALSRFSRDAILISLALIAADRWLMYWRWALLIRAASTEPPRDLPHVFFVSAFIGSFLPAGVGGDAARAVSMSRQSGEVGPAVASVIVDRWIGLLAVAASGCAGLLLSLAAVPRGLRGLTFAATMLLAIASVAGLYSDRIVVRLLPQSWRRVRAARVVLRLADALTMFRRHPGVLWRVSLLSIAVQALRITLAWVIGRGLGITLPFSYYWVFMPLNILLILIPVSLGGIGLPQGAMIWTLGPLGVPATEAFLLSLLFVLAGVVGNLPGALMYIRGRVGPPRNGAPA